MGRFIKEYHQRATWDLEKNTKSGREIKKLSSYLCQEKRQPLTHKACSMEIGMSSRRTSAMEDMPVFHWASLVTIQ